MWSVASHDVVDIDMIVYCRHLDEDGFNAVMIEPTLSLTI